MQADMMLEKDMSVLKEEREPLGLFWASEISKSTPSDTLLQQGHTP